MKVLLFFIFVAASVAAAQALTITPGFTFAVASSTSDTTVGDHFHSSSGDDFGNPAGKAEVGSFFEEEVRGLSEYDLTGLGASPTAFVTFEVNADEGLFEGQNDFAYVGGFIIKAYEGNNLEDISDYKAPSTGTVDPFSTAGLAVGDTLSFDITAICNAAIADGDASLGIRLEITGTPNGGAWVFDTFRLTTDDRTNRPRPDTVVPAPAALPLLAMAIGLVAATRLRRRR